MKKFPHFILVGTAKAGTSFLLKYLRQHPDIYLPNSNELYFHSKLKDFEGPYDKDALKKQTRNFEEYVKNFDVYDGQKVIGEFATDYLYAYEESIKSIQETIGKDIKIVIILRNPVDRTFSHYKHLVSKFQEPLDFLDAIHAQNERKQKKWRWVYQYTEISKYYEQVKAFKEAFKNIHIVIYDDLKDNPKNTINEVYAFLKVNSIHFDNIKEKVNVKRLQKNKVLFLISKYMYILEQKIFKKSFIGTKISKINERKLFLTEEDSKKIYQYFKEDIEKLENLLQKDLSIWKKYK